MKAKTVLVTGAADGIGRETARQLLALGYRVLVHGRNREKAGRAAQQLAKASPPGATAPVWGDLSRMHEVVRLAQQVRSRCEALDVLINNAGFNMKGCTVEEGARTSVFLATSDTVAGVSGKYFDNCRETQSSARAREETLAQALWQASEAALAGFLSPRFGRTVVK